MNARGIVLLTATAVALLSVGCKSTVAPPAVSGAALFGAACARCHGATGGGGVAVDGGPAPRNFRDGAFHGRITDDQIRRTIVEGKGAGMPAFGATFNDAQIRALVDHVRSFDPRRNGP